MKKYVIVKCPICNSIVAGCTIDIYDDEVKEDMLSLKKEGFLIEHTEIAPIINVCNCEYHDRNLYGQAKITF